MVLAVSKENQFIKVPVTVLKATKGKPTELQVWVALARHLNQKRGDGLVWPSQTSIGKIVGLSRIRINQVIKMLIEKHLIEEVEAPKGMPKVYRVLNGVYKGCKGDLTGVVNEAYTNNNKKQEKETMFKPIPRKWAGSNGKYFLERINSLPRRKGEIYTPNQHGLVWVAIKEAMETPEYLEELLKLEFWDRVYGKCNWQERSKGNAGYGTRGAYIMRQQLALIDTASDKAQALEDLRRKQQERFNK